VCNRKTDVKRLGLSGEVLVRGKKKPPVRQEEGQWRGGILGKTRKKDCKALAPGRGGQIKKKKN